MIGIFAYACLAFENPFIILFAFCPAGSEKLKEWVALNGEGGEAPKIRIARPITAMPFEGTRKRRRAAMGDYTWSVGDRVDAWMQNRYACLLQYSCDAWTNIRWEHNC